MNPLALVGAGTSLIGGILGSKGQNKAAKAQQAAYDEQLRLQQQIASQAQGSYDKLLPMFAKDQNTAARFASADERNKFSDLALAGLASPSLATPAFGVGFQQPQSAGLLARYLKTTQGQLEQEKQAKSLLAGYFDALKKQSIAGQQTAADVGLAGAKSRAYASAFPLQLGRAGTQGSGMSNFGAFLQGLGNIGMFAGMAGFGGGAAGDPVFDPANVAKSAPNVDPSAWY